LAAYWVCQGWGNNPKEYSREFKNTLQSHLTSKRMTGGGKYEAALSNVDWSYHIDTYPIIFVLNTRTRRVYGDNKMAQLVEEQELERIRKMLARLEKKYRTSQDSQSVLLISPAPVYGFTAVELLQLKFSSVLTAEKVDAESWIGNPQAFANLYKVFNKVFTRNCLIMSGDVHYSFNRLEHIRQNHWEKPVDIIQLTCSSACNQPQGLMKLSLNVLESISKMKCFNRINSRYIYPKSGRHFLSGDCNIGHLNLENAKPKSYSLYFYDDNSNRQYTWEYDLANPDFVVF
jgi:phosphodiesterase/alkaline phosphatase D-like protein